MDEILPKIQNFIDRLMNIVSLNSIDDLDRAIEESKLSEEDLEFFMNSK